MDSPPPHHAVMENFSESVPKWCEIMWHVRMTCSSVTIYVLWIVVLDWDQHLYTQGCGDMPVFCFNIVLNTTMLRMMACSLSIRLMKYWICQTWHFKLKQTGVCLPTKCMHRGRRLVWTHLLGEQRFYIDSEFPRMELHLLCCPVSPHGMNLGKALPEQTALMWCKMKAES